MMRKLITFDKDYEISLLIISYDLTCSKKEGKILMFLKMYLMSMLRSSGIVKISIIIQKFMKGEYLHGLRNRFTEIIFLELSLEISL